MFAVVLPFFYSVFHFFSSKQSWALPTSPYYTISLPSFVDHGVGMGLRSRHYIYRSSRLFGLLATARQSCSNRSQTSFLTKCISPLFSERSLSRTGSCIASFFARDVRKEDSLRFGARRSSSRGRLPPLWRRFEFEAMRYTGDASTRTQERLRQIDATMASEKHAATGHTLIESEREPVTSRLAAFFKKMGRRVWPRDHVTKGGHCHFFHTFFSVSGSRVLAQLVAVLLKFHSLCVLVASAENRKRIQWR